MARTTSAWSIVSLDPFMFFIPMSLAVENGRQVRTAMGDAGKAVVCSKGDVVSRQVGRLGHGRLVGRLGLNRPKADYLS